MVEKSKNPNHINVRNKKFKFKFIQLQGIFTQLKTFISIIKFVFATE